MVLIMRQKFGLLWNFMELGRVLMRVTMFEELNKV